MPRTTRKATKPTRAVTGKPKQSTAVEVVDNFGLTDKQRLFIEQYFIFGLNATDAAMAVYDCKDRNVARNMGAENLAKPAIRARIDARLAAHHLTAEEVLARLAYHARGSFGDFVDADSGVIDLAKAKHANQLGLIKRYKTKHIVNAKDDTETTETEIELYDQQNALQLIGKTLNLFTDRSVNLNIDLTKLSDEELRRLAEGGKL